MFKETLNYGEQELRLGEKQEQENLKKERRLREGEEAAAIKVKKNRV